VERRILGLFALQTPVASDLRLLTALLHINLHLEHIADQAVNPAKITKSAASLPPSLKVLQHLEEMGALALGMVGAAMHALARRDLELARSLPEMDDPIDRLNRGMLQQMLAVSDDKQMLEWGIRMYVVSRQIERIGDNAVDIAEQVAFLVTGEFREFTDASHPEIEHPELLNRGGSPGVVDHNRLHPGPTAAACRRARPAACAVSEDCLEFVQRTPRQASGAAGGTTRPGGQGRRARTRERTPRQGAGGHAAHRRADGGCAGVERGTVADPGAGQPPRVTRVRGGRGPTPT
jgi:phosphate transport system protein